MVAVCTVPARGGRSCEHFGGYKTINRIPLPLYTLQPVITHYVIIHQFYFYGASRYVYVRELAYIHDLHCP